MRHLQLIAIGVAGTLLAIVLSSFFFPKTWHVENSVRVDANIQTTFALIADAREHLNWNPSYEDVEVINQTPDEIAVSTNSGSATFRLAIEQRHEPDSVDAFTTGAGRSKVLHYWHLTEDGAGTLVTWTAESAHKRKFLGRFANIPIKAWMADDVGRSLQSLKRASERRQIGTVER